MSHTYAILEVSRAAWEEIAAKLREFGYHQAFHEAGAIDMHGIALQAEVADRNDTPQRPGGLTEDERAAAQAEMNATSRARLDALKTAAFDPDGRPSEPLHSTTTIGPDGEPMTVRHQHAYGSHRFLSPWRLGDPTWHKPPNQWPDMPGGLFKSRALDPSTGKPWSQVGYAAEDPEVAELWLGRPHNIYVGDVYTGVVHNVAADKPNEGTPDDRHDRPDSPIHDEGALGAQAAEADAAGGGSLRVRPPAHDREPIGAATGGAGAGRDAPEHVSVPDLPDARAAGALDREISYERSG